MPGEEVPSTPHHTAVVFMYRWRSPIATPFLSTHSKKKKESKTALK
jgi:hypothetical protein